VIVIINNNNDILVSSVLTLDETNVSDAGIKIAAVEREGKIFFLCVKICSEQIFIVVDI
jgi:hypothetical protein